MSKLIDIFFFGHIWTQHCHLICVLYVDTLQKGLKDLVKVKKLYDHCMPNNTVINFNS